MVEDDFQDHGPADASDEAIETADAPRAQTGHVQAAGGGWGHVPGDDPGGHIPANKPDTPDGLLGGIKTTVDAICGQIRKLTSR